MWFLLLCHFIQQLLCIMNVQIKRLGAEDREKCVLACLIVYV